MNHFYVYLYLRKTGSRNGPKGSPYYIGKGCNRRAFERHLGVRKPTDRSYIVFWMSGISEEEAHLEEMRLISIYGRIDNGTGYLRNRTDGGEGHAGIVYSDERREKISRAHKGRIFTDEHRHNISRAAQKRTLTQSHKSALRQSMQGRTLTPEWRAAISAGKKGKKRKPISEEHRKKIGEFFSKLPRSDEWRQNISESLKGRTLSASHCAAISASKMGKKKYN